MGILLAVTAPTYRTELVQISFPNQGQIVGMPLLHHFDGGEFLNLAKMNRLLPKTDYFKQST